MLTVYSICGSQPGGRGPLGGNMTKIKILLLPIDSIVFFVHTTHLLVCSIEAKVIGLIGLEQHESKL